MSKYYVTACMALVACSAVFTYSADYDEAKVKKQSSLGDRPSEVQDAVDRAFEAIKDETIWYRNGNSEYYTLMSSDEDKLFEQLLLKCPDKKDIYIFDVGCGKGRWGRNAFEALQKEEYKKSGKRFHIFSITGGKECKQLKTEQDNVILYQLNQVKIENLDEELAARGFNLEGKVDLIVSNWTLRHLADPFGTLKRLYNLLNPDQGLLMSNGFLFKFDDSSEIEGFPDRNEDLLITSGATALFRNWDESRDAGQFALMRNDANELAIPLEYAGKINYIKSERTQCASGKVTVFKRQFANKKICFEDAFEMVNNSRKIYCQRGDQRCLELYHKLKDYFYKDNHFYKDDNI